MKWYYWLAIGLGLSVAYYLFAPKTAYRPGMVSSSSSSKGWLGGMFSGLGDMLRGGGDLIDSIYDNGDSGDVEG